MERKDQWTPDEDRLLADIVLQSIRDLGTQLQAFEKAGLELHRTASACGFRWNSTVRKTYENDIAAAKQERRQKKEKPTSRRAQNLIPSASLPAGGLLVDEIRQIMNLLEQKVQQLFEDNARKDSQILDLEQKLSDQHPEAAGDYDLKHLIEILNRARQLGAFEKIG